MSTTDSIRIAFEAWCRKEQGYLYKDEAEPGTPQEDKWLGFQAGAAHAASAQSAQVAQGELPLLPKGTWFACDHESGVQFHPSEDQAKRYAIDSICVAYFSADQMRDYARAAIAASQQSALPPEWISEVCGPEVDGLSYGQGYRRGFNDCRKQVLELRAASQQAAEPLYGATNHPQAGRQPTGRASDPT